MINKKRAIIILAAVLVIVISMTFLVKDYEMAYGKAHRTKEECMWILLYNREDFEYVARIMQKYPSDYIEFDNGTAGTSKIKINDIFLCSSREIAIEILSNEEFYYHLMNLYKLDVIWAIEYEQHDESFGGNIIMFYFTKFPKDYHGGVYYGTNIKNDAFTYIIDENWGLLMLPNV